MSITYLEYTVNLPDKDKVAALQAATSLIHLPRNSNPGGWNTAVGLIASLIGANRTVGDLFGSPKIAAIRAELSAPVITTKDQIVSPCITSPWIVDLAQTTNPIAVDQFNQPHGGFFGFLGDFFAPKTFVWKGTYAYVPAAVTTVGTVGGGTVPVAAISQRRFIEGFEHPEQGEGGTSGGAALLFSRVASRHVDGMGLALRATDGVKTHTQTQFGATLTNKTWERLYIRLVANPSADTTFWRTRATAGSMGLALSINATGRVTLNDVTNAGVLTPVGTTLSSLAKGQWYRLDIFFQYGASAFAKMYLNGVQQLNVTAFAGSGLASVTTHVSSEVGSAGQSANNLGLDIDDWMAAELPPVDGMGNLILTGNDFNNGSRMIRIGATAFSADNVWAGDWRSALQMPGEDGTAGLSSSTSGARLSVDTDAATQIGGEPGSIGCVAIVVGKYGNRGGSGNGDLGYAIAGGETVESPTEFGTFEWANMMYRPSGLITPASVVPFKLIHDKAASGSLATIFQFGAVAELIGVFGQEDVAPSTAGATPAPVLSGTGLHNAPYARTAWAKAGLPPLSPVIITAGQYVGNGVGQDIVFRTPIHWLWVRHVNSAHDGTFWFSSQIAAHESVEEVWDPAGMVAALIDPAFVPVTGTDADEGTQTLIRIAGSAAHVNQNGETYQYVAISDPGMRFMLNGVLFWPFGSADQISPLINTNFLPEAAFFSKEALNGGSSVKTAYKGIGHATQSLSFLGAAETASAAAFGRGSITSRSALHFSGAGTAIPFSAFRRDDGINDAGKLKVLQLASYTGNGTSPRVIALTPASGVRPLLALVVPHDAAAVIRDPAHTGTTSTTLPASNDSANGIQAGGVDSITVGSDLNTLGTIYDVFVLPGSISPLNNGFSSNGEFAPVDPAAPVDGPFIPAPTGDPTTIELPDTGNDTGDTGGTVGDDFGTQCVAGSTKIINQALSHIGINIPIADITADATVEAETARLHYQDDVEATLREFDWPFATGYATLTLDGGDPTSPHNRDWIYSYFAPGNMLKARRLVRDGIGRKYDPLPATFKVGTNTAFPTILSDEPDAVLEYTFRPSCAATAGDALFRDALSWRVAMSLAPSLSRNKVTASDCYQMYMQKLALAAKVGANETQQEPGADASWISGRN